MVNTISRLHRVSWKFALYAANSRVRRNRPCSPSFFSGREKCQEKPPPRVTNALSRNYPPPWCGRSIYQLHMGYPTPSRSLSYKGNSFTRSRSWFRSKLKLHFQKAIFTRKCSTSEQNWQLRKNFWEVLATSKGKVTNFQRKVITLLQNQENGSVIPFLCPKKIFVL